ncbi:hypothetical protein T4D_5380 [Trichinella pseudospiralis]|uniref:Uncharacterized protein n=1 Tax=Trichinella pseudospiralis TaxID=6337 RepID=A0A0V1FPH8_TRIPS|nr:hypothetical protein T4D_5380 [Trichinella pseudospiralis]
MLYLQSICRRANSSRSFSADFPCSKVRKKESACLNVRKLSDWITLGLPRWAMNRRKAAKKLIDVMFITSSKCTAGVTLHVNKQMYTFCKGCCSSFTCSGPAKSNPTLLNGKDGVALSGGRSLISGQNGRAASFRHVMQALMHLLTA